MNIVVLVKQVPDSGADRNLRSDDNTVDRGSANNVINEMDEYAIEEALKIKEAHGGEVTILTMGPEKATESIRKALSMGPDKAVHVVDGALHGSCAVATSKVLAAALQKLNADLILCGSESTDGRVQVLPHMLAERLGVAALTGARKLTSVRHHHPGAGEAQRTLLGPVVAGAGCSGALRCARRGRLRIAVGDRTDRMVRERRQLRARPQSGPGVSDADHDGSCGTTAGRAARVHSRSPFCDRQLARDRHSGAQWKSSFIVHLRSGATVTSSRFYQSGIRRLLRGDRQ